MSSNVYALIMAGGLGTRIRPLSLFYQKTMLPVGYRFKPVIEYILRNLKYHGIKNVIISVSYLSNQVIKFIENLEITKDMNINFIIENEPYGTGYSIIKTYEEYVKDNHSALLIHYGDILTNLDIRDLVNYWLNCNCDGVVVGVPNYQLPVSVIEFDENGIIKSFIEKPILNIIIGIGIVLLSVKAIEFLYKQFKDNRIGIDLMKDMIPKLIESGYKLKIYIPKQENFFWIDIGTLDTYMKLDFNKIDKIFSYLFE